MIKVPGFNIKIIRAARTVSLLSALIMLLWFCYAFLNGVYLKKHEKPVSNTPFTTSGITFHTLNNDSPEKLSISIAEIRLQSKKIMGFGLNIDPEKELMLNDLQIEINNADHCRINSEYIEWLFTEGYRYELIKQGTVRLAKLRSLHLNITSKGNNAVEVEAKNGLIDFKEKKIELNQTIIFIKKSNTYIITKKLIWKNETSGFFIPGLYTVKTPDSISQEASSPLETLLKRFI